MSGISLGSEELTPEEKKQQIIEAGKEVMLISANSIMINIRFMNYAVGRLELRQKLDCGHMTTDGQYIVYDPEYILKQYKLQREQHYEICTRSYLHSVLHCVMQHMFVSPAIDRKLWNLACDIAIENMISELNTPFLQTGKPVLQEPYILEITKNVSYMTAEHIYDFFVNVCLYDEENNKKEIAKAPLIYAALNDETEKKELKDLIVAFYVDHHDIWYMDDGEKFDTYDIGNPPSQESGEEESDDSSNGHGRSSRKSSRKSGGDDDEFDGDEFGGDDDEFDGDEFDGDGDEFDGDDDEFDNSSDSAESRAKLAAEWADIAERMQQELEGFSKLPGSLTGSLVRNLKAVNREKYNYTSFLKQFAVMGEEMKVNEDEFDYIYYTYGLDHYGNVPLIEPLEYKDVKKIKEFVIAVDTSGSTTNLVQTFLQKTYNIMLSTDSYFKKTNIRIIQCDAEITEDHLITSVEEFEDYISNLQIKGFGGTDFRPVFKCVDKHIADGDFTNLKGMIYFTDGYGTFPDKIPEYKTAFVFLENLDNDYDDVPVWAIKLILKKGDVESGNF